MKRKVAIIDSGVNKDDPLLQGKKIENLYYSEGEFQSCYISSGNMHGTEIVKVLLHEAPDVEILSVRVLQEDNRCMISAVLSALRYCIEKQVDVINLSLGGCSNRGKHIELMRELCSEAEHRGIAVFAANHNMPGKVAYPAYFENVIGVNTSNRLEHYCQVSFQEQIVNFSENMVYIPDDARCVIRKGNSYLCPFIVGLFCRFAGRRKIDVALKKEFMLFLDKLSNAQSIRKIFFDRSKLSELDALNGKRILFFADEWDYNNQQIFNIYEERAKVHWCFQEIYKKDFNEVQDIIGNSDIFFIGALGNEFMYHNGEYLQALIEYLAKIGIEILMVFPILNTFGRIQLTEVCGKNVQSFYK